MNPKQSREISALDKLRGGRPNGKGSLVGHPRQLVGVSLQGIIEDGPQSKQESLAGAAIQVVGRMEGRNDRLSWSSRSRIGARLLAAGNCCCGGSGGGGTRLGNQVRLTVSSSLHHAFVVDLGLPWSRLCLLFLRHWFFQVS